MSRTNWNPTFKLLWDYCQRKPHAKEDHPWDETVFKIGGKIFAFLGRPERDDDHVGVTVKALPDELKQLLAMPYIKLASYIGRFGWVSVSIEDDRVLELAYELIDNSYALIKAKTKYRDSAKNSAQKTAKSKKKE